MSKREPRFEIVHTGPYKFHARFVTANNEIVWTTESYRTRRAAREAVDLLVSRVTASTPLRYVDERTP